MATPSETLVKYDPPVLVNKTDMKSRKPTSEAAEAPGQGIQEILNRIFPPREWMEGNQLWVQQVSSAPFTRADIIQLEELLDRRLQQSQARGTGICPQRTALSFQCFDELIRQVTIECAERGALLLMVRDQIQMTFGVYQALNEGSMAFGTRKALQAELGKADEEKTISDLEEENRDLKKQLSDLTADNETIEKRENEQQRMENEKHAEKIQVLTKANEQFRNKLEGIIAAKTQNIS
ncbi:33 kDa inner dynein arm light chain, axonemal [Gasterosteus aculeatus]